MNPPPGSPARRRRTTGAHGGGGGRLDPSHRAHRRHGRPRRPNDDDDDFLHRSLIGAPGGGAPRRSRGLDHEAGITSQEEELRVAYLAPTGREGRAMQSIPETTTFQDSSTNSTIQKVRSKTSVGQGRKSKTRRVTLSGERPRRRTATISAIVANNLGSPVLGSGSTNQNGQRWATPGSSGMVRHLSLIHISGAHETT